MSQSPTNEIKTPFEIYLRDELIKKKRKNKEFYEEILQLNKQTRGLEATVRALKCSLLVRDQIIEARNLELKGERLKIMSLIEKFRHLIVKTDDNKMRVSDEQLSTLRNAASKDFHYL